MALGNVSQALNVVGQTAFLEVWCQRGSQASVARLAYNISAIVGAGITYGDFVDFMTPLYAPVMKAVLSADAMFRGCLVREVANPPASPPAPAFNNASAGAGLVVGNAMPSQVSGLIKFGTRLGGRKGHGRMYVPFPNQTSTGALGDPLPAYVASLTAIGAVVTPTRTIVGAGGGSATFVPCIFHRVAETVTPISFATPSPSWATQRRRGDFGRANSSPV